MNGYDLSRNWFNWCFENPEKINTNHTALYFFCVEHCNRLGWKSNFGLPTTMAKEAIGIRSYNTYIKTLNDLVDFGFIKLIEKSKNQYSSNIIALSKFNKATNKALDKALIKHTTKQGESTVQSTSSIDKPVTSKPLNNKPKEDDFVSLEFLDAYNTWMTYKKERNESYKSITGREKFYNSLVKLSVNNPNIALQIINQSMANNWAGIFPVKEEPKKPKDQVVTLPKEGTIKNNTYNG